MYELKHWFRCGQSWNTDNVTLAAAIEQWRRRLNACDMCVKAQGDILDNICVEFTCSPLVYLLNRTVGLCNIQHLTFLPGDFVRFMSYDSRFCAFCG